MPSNSTLLAFTAVILLSNIAVFLTLPLANEGVFFNPDNRSIVEGRWRLLQCATACFLREYEANDGCSESAFDIFLICYEQRDLAAKHLHTNASLFKPFTDFYHKGRSGLPERHVCANILNDPSFAANFCPIYARYLAKEFEHLLRLVLLGVGQEASLYVNIEIYDAREMGKLLEYPADAEERSALRCLRMGMGVRPRQYAAYTLLSLLSFPMDIVTSILNAVVMRQIVTSENIVIFAFHAGVLVSNGGIYFANLFGGTGLKIVNLLFHWACYIPAMLTPTNATLSGPLLTELLTLFGDIFMIAFVMLSSLLQTAVAFDRAVGLGYPVWYMANVTGGYVKRSIVGLCLLSLLPAVLRIVTYLRYYFYKLSRDLEFNLTLILPFPPDEFDFNRDQKPAVFYTNGLQYALVVVSNCLQSLACAYVAWKITSHRRARKRMLQGSQPQSVKSTANSYLLIATCVINDAVLGVVLWSTFRPSNEHFRALICVCCSFGFYIHCCCCALYRKRVIKLLRLDKLAKLIGRKDFILQRIVCLRCCSAKARRVVAPH